MLLYDKSDVTVVLVVPLEGPTVMMDGKPGRNDAKLMWQAPQQAQGFITNYTIFYETETHEKHSMCCPALFLRIAFPDLSKLPVLLADLST